MRDEYGTDFVLNTDLLLSISEAMQDDEPIDRARIKGWRRELCDRNAAHRRFINGLNRAGFSDAEQRESIIWLKTAVEQQYMSESELARLTSDQDAAAG